MDEPPEGPLLEPLPRSTPSTSSERVFQSLLAGIYDGTLPSGTRLSEHAVAAEYGVSRTPAREAVQRLRELGLIEASAGRASRVVEIDEDHLADALVAWEALYAALVDEVVSTIENEDLERMAASAAAFRSASAARDVAGASDANLQLFAVPLARSTNPTLVEAITATVYVVRLGSHRLPRWIDAARLAEAQRALVTALGDRDAAAAKSAVHRAAQYELVPE